MLSFCPFGSENFLSGCASPSGGTNGASFPPAGQAADAPATSSYRFL